MLASVGRVREGAAMLDEVVRTDQPTPGLLYQHVVALWAAGRPFEADRAMADVWRRFPRHFAVWYSRFYLLSYTGRSAEALAMADDVDSWPSGSSPEQMDWIVRFARAARSRAPEEIDAVIALGLEWARRGTGYAENAIQFASALGRPDPAFAIADAYYFDRGFRVPDMRFVTGQGTHMRLQDRRTMILFLPPTALLRRDPRFVRLTEALGLERYWRDSGTRPDYRA